MTVKKTALFILFGMCINFMPIKVSAYSDIEAISQWLYASYSFGTDINDDTVIGGMKLYKGEDIVYPVESSEENGWCGYRIDNVTHDSSMYRTEKENRSCAAAVKHYCSARSEDKRIVGGYIYFDAGKNFTVNDRNLTFEIEYFDEGTRNFGIRYVNGEDTFGVIEISRSDTKKWKTEKFTVNDAYFNKSKPTLLGDGTCDFRIEDIGGEVAIGKISLYNYADNVSGRSYKAVSLGNTPTQRAYFTQSMWSADSKNILLRAGDGWVYEYNVADETSKKIAKTSSDFYVSPGNYFYYVNTVSKTINRISLDTYEEEVLTGYPDGADGTPNYIHVNNADTKLTVMFYENSSDKDWEIGENGNLERRNRRIPIYDIVTGEWDLRYTHEFGAGTPQMTHLMINPEYDNLVFFCHEGTTTKIPDRMWTINTDTGEKKNIFIQQNNSLDQDSPIKTGETSGHENWTADGEHMVFVKYPYDTNVGMNGIVRVDKYGEDREYINDDYRYWHCHPSSDNRFVTADTMLTGASMGTNVNMSFGSSEIVLIDIKTSSSILLTKIKAGGTHPYQPHPAFSPNGKLVAFSCSNGDELLQVGIMDITDLTAGKEGEVFESNTNEDKGAVVSEPFVQNGRSSVTVNGTLETDLNLFGAEYDSEKRLTKVKLLEDTVNKGETKELIVDGISNEGKIFLWKSNGVPFSFIPSAPEKLRVVKAMSNSITLGWFPPSNLSSSGIKYDIWRDGTKIGTVSDGYFKDCDVDENTEYYYEVRAVYPQGSVSPCANIKAKTMSGEIYSVISSPIINSGLNFLENSSNPNADSYTEETEIGGKTCRKSTLQYAEGKNKTGKFYFVANIGYISPSDHDIEFTVTYYDNGTAPIYIEYNASDGSVAKRFFLTERQNTCEWMTASVSVSDAEFVRAHSLSDCDFRIEGGADTYIYEAKVKNLSTQSGEALQESYCTLGNEINNEGLIFYQENSGDSSFFVDEKGGKSCVCIENGKYMYFDVDDNFIYGDAKRGISIEIEYFDDNTDYIYLQYNTNDETYTFNKAYKQCLFVKKTGSGEWKKAKIILVDTCFKNSQDDPYKSDFRIFSSSVLSVHGVKVTAIP
jgi:hypothetical protein